MGKMKETKKDKSIKFRNMTTNSGKIVFAGKDSESNEEIIKQVSGNEFVLHTKAPGSPFVNIKEDNKKVNNKDIKEAAVFCARYSRDWKKNQKDVEVHLFRGTDVYKNKGMKLGTFGVKKFKIIKVKKKEIDLFVEGELKK